MRKKMVHVIVGLLMVCGLTAVCFSAPSKQVIKISFGSSDNHPITKTLREHYIKLINQKIKNKYDIQVYTNAQLGDDVRATEAVKAGMLDAVVTTLAPVGGIVKETMVFDLPFLFTDEQVADKILSGPVVKTLDQKMAKKGMICLAWYENGFRHLSNNVREIKSPADLKGLKIRTMENPIHLAAWRKLGANPTPMPFSEVFTALQQHVIDGQENPIPTFYDGKFYEVQKYLTLTGHIYSPYVLLFSKKVFDKMPKKDQKIFLQVGKETEPINRKIVRAAAKANLDYVVKQGLTVTNLTSKQKKVFQDMLQPVWDQFSNKIGINIIKQVRTELSKLSN
jgi:tripartite ATP-independent transporter DctP family solute receptor